MKRLFFLLSLLCLLSLHASAINLDSLMNVEKKEAHKIPRQVLTYSFNINTATDGTFSHQLDYQWYALKYMGIGLGMEYDRNDVAAQQARDDNNGYVTYYDEDAVRRLNFLPMLCFRTPTVWFSHDRSWGMMLRCDPMLAWRLRNALSFYNEFGMLSIGVSFSDYNIYSCRNHMIYRGKQIFDRGFGHTTTVFISLGACL